MDLDANESNCPPGKRWRDSCVFQHGADSAAGPFSAFFLTPKVQHERNGDENSVLAANNPCHVDDFRRRRKKPRVDNYVLTPPPSGSHHLFATTEDSQADENTPPGVEWWRQRPARNDASRNTATTACFICTKPIVPQQPLRLPLKPNTLLNYFSTNSAAASASTTQQSHEPHLSLRHDDRQQLRACTFCERFVCRTCTRVCQRCDENFCTLCSMVDYRHADEESSYCLDCLAMQMSTTGNPEQLQVHGDAMQLD